jgi:penicillin-insensitive murein endopeptidase
MNWFTRLVSTLLISHMSCAYSGNGIGTRTSASEAKDNDALFAKWAAIKNPTAGPATPVGTYQAGCLSGGVTVPADGAGYAIMRLARNHFYAHPNMNTYLQALSERLRSQNLPLLLVGDVSPPRGGPMKNGHNSHQTGLDADLWLMMSKSRPSTRERESWGAPSYVVKRKKLKKAWGATQAKLVSTAADSAEVARIFVSPPIKKYFCKTNPSAPWLYKLRAWWGHEEHIHVRLNCPAGASTCVPQAPVNPNDNGCGQELDWWFSKEADDEWTKMSTHPTPREFPELPAACEDVANR